VGYFKKPPELKRRVSGGRKPEQRGGSVCGSEIIHSCVIVVFLAGLQLGCGLDGLENKHPKGEVAILKAIALSNVQPANSCFLQIDHEGSTYMGCLLFDDEIICGQITKILQGYLKRPIAEIGSLDLSHTL
jgi:hypothetical protein